MNKTSLCVVVVALACSLALFAGCATSGGSSSAPSSAAASSASAEASASAAAVDAANLTNGEYQIAVTLQGGSGKATVESPAKLEVQDGKMTATIVWSSPNYDQMVIDGEQFLPVPRAGNSTFQIPVSALDVDIPIQAETTAMSEPHMIDYTLHFDSSSIK